MRYFLCIIALLGAQIAFSQLSDDGGNTGDQKTDVDNDNFDQALADNSSNTFSFDYGLVGGGTNADFMHDFCELPVDGLRLWFEIDEKTNMKPSVLARYANQDYGASTVKKISNVNVNISPGELQEALVNKFRGINPNLQSRSQIYDIMVQNETGPMYYVRARDQYQHYGLDSEGKVQPAEVTNVMEGEVYWAYMGYHVFRGKCGQTSVCLHEIPVPYDPGKSKGGDPGLVASGGGDVHYHTHHHGGGSGGDINIENNNTNTNTNNGGGGGHVNPCHGRAQYRGYTCCHQQPCGILRGGAGLFSYNYWGCQGGFHNQGYGYGQGLIADCYNCVPQHSGGGGVSVHYEDNSVEDSYNTDNHTTQTNVFYTESNQTSTTGGGPGENPNGEEGGGPGENPNGQDPPGGNPNDNPNVKAQYAAENHMTNYQPENSGNGQTLGPGRQTSHTAHTSTNSTPSISPTSSTGSMYSHGNIGGGSGKVSGPFRKPGG